MSVPRKILGSELARRADESSRERAARAKARTACGEMSRPRRASLDIASTPNQQRASSKGKPYRTANGTARGDARRGFSRNSMSGCIHTSTVFGKTGASTFKLLRRIERLEACAAARIGIEADIQAAIAILSEPGIWKRNSRLAQKAMIALHDVYGFEALLLELH